MAASSGDAFAHLLSSDDVRYEIQLQSTILLSIEDGPQGYHTIREIQESKQRLEALRALLKRREVEEQGKHAFPSHASLSPLRSMSASPTDTRV